MKWLNYQHLFCCLLGAFLFANVVSAQLKVYDGNSFPKKASEGNWYYNPEKPGKVWVFTQSHWEKLLAGDGRPPFLHQGLIWIPIKEHHTLATTAGKIIISDASLVVNNGKVFLGVSSTVDFFAITLAGDTLSYYQFRYLAGHHGLRGDPEWMREKRGDTIFEILPQYVPSMKDFRLRDFRNWGMLGPEGNWVIPPVFDEPFHFYNGFADVLYYGQKRKINEKGEFVE